MEKQSYMWRAAATGSFAEFLSFPAEKYSDKNQHLGL